jgi:hypothetical protein
LLHCHGRLLVKGYYAVSPPIAAFIGGSDALRWAARVMIWPGVACAWVALNTTGSEKVAWACGLLLIGALAGAVCPRVRADGRGRKAGYSALSLKLNKFYTQYFSARTPEV